jgi:hypothetical protein
MTRKDYELIAKALRVEMDKVDTTFHRSSPNHVHTLTDQELSAMRRASVVCAIVRVCDALEEENPRFDADIFRRACGIDGL